MVTSMTRIVGQTAYSCSPRCRLWYQRIMETTTTEQTTRNTVDPEVDLQDSQLSTPRPLKRQRLDDGEPDDNPAHFRRVRLRYRDRGDFAGADAKKRRGRAAPPGRCHSCNRAETPEWRRGPNGAKTLCNACRLRMCLPYLFKLLVANSLQTTPNLPGKWGLQRRRMEAQHG